MDESEKLIALVALGTPSQAVKAWNLWNEKNSKKEASTILSWSGGYMYHNLEKAGYEDKYLHGIYLHNKISNNLKFTMAEQILNGLNKEFGIIPIKSFGMSNRDFSWGFRPVADFDFYVSDSHLEDIWKFMEFHKVAPLMGISQNEFLSKILWQRGSWNFVKEKEFDIDVHWRLFDHLSLSQNRELIAIETERTGTCEGFNSYLTTNLEIVLLANHFYYQGDKKFNGLFDFYNVSNKVDPEKVIDIVKKTGTIDAFRSTMDLISGILGKNVNSTFNLIHKHFQDSVYSDKKKVREKRRYFNQINRDDFEPNLHRHKHLYKLWNFLGRHTFMERFILRLFGPFNQQIFREECLIELKEVENLSIGWHHIYGNDSFRWTHSPDTRLTFNASKGESYKVLVELDDDSWKSSPTGAFNLFLNGDFIQTCTKQFSEYNWIYSTNFDFIEISIRPNILLDYRKSSNFNWNRMSTPVKKISLTRQ